MKRIIFSIIIMFFLSVSVYAQEDTNATDQTCPGNWILLNPSGWVVQNEFGVMLPLTAATQVFGCDKKAITLDEELSGVSVDIRCEPSAVENGLPDIVSIFIVCE